MAGSIAVFCSSMGVVYDTVRTLVLVVGAALALAAAQLAFEASAPFAVLTAVGFCFALVIALYLIWHSRLVAKEQARGARQSLFSLQRQARARGFRRLLSGFGAVFGACVILLIGFAAMTSGSVTAGLMFFCSGVMAMRAAWTLLWVQRGTRGI